MAVQTRAEGGKLYIGCPYSKGFISEIKRIGGRWSAPEWAADLRQEDRAREILRECFGEDGTEAPSDTVSIRLTGTEWNDSKEENRLSFLGRTVAYRRGRDMPVTFGDGVVVVDADFADSAGSMRYPEIGLLTGHPVFEVYDLPRSVYEKMKDIPGVELLQEQDPNGARKEALLQERERLVSRLAEIDQELKEMDGKA